MASNDYDRVVFDVLSSTGVPVARAMWGPHPPECPRATYISHPKYGYGDNCNSALMPHYSCTLFMDEWDDYLADRFEQAVRELGTFTRRDEWDEASEKFVSVYDLFLVNRSAA